MKVLELFSGIGGMRTGVSEVVPDAEFVAVDLNQGCNEIYTETFGDSPTNLDISSLPAEWFAKIQADCWTMSPPCQPYSRQGNQKDLQDPRAAPLINICHALKTLPTNQLPNLILLENVKNFELSESFANLKHILQARKFALFGYLLNPLYMGFPNSRLRFFLVAVRQKTDESEIAFVMRSNDPQYQDWFDPDLFSDSAGNPPIGQFLCTNHAGDFLNVPESLLKKRAAFCFDIVAPRSKQSMCFTSAYTKFIEGTGSVLFTGDSAGIQYDAMDRPIFPKLEEMKELEGKLRYFCPLEVARLNGFTSKTLKITDGCKAAKRYYRALGNSLNPTVVSHLVRRHFIV